MLSSSKELKNIPVSISILHEQEYNNICLMLKMIKSRERKRRAFSEKSIDKTEESINETASIKLNDHRRQTLKN
jgi:hypothetical protein